MKVGNSTDYRRFKHWKTLENYTTILISFTVEVELLRSTTPMALPGTVQIIICHNELHLLQWVSITIVFLQASQCILYSSHNSFCPPWVLSERLNLKRSIYHLKNVPTIMYISHSLGCLQVFICVNYKIFPTFYLSKSISFWW